MIVPGALLLTACASGAAPVMVTAPDGPPALADLAFMSGCWNGTFTARDQQGVIEEHYTTPSDDVMLGTTRYLLDGRTVQFELTTIRMGEDGTIVLQPYPGGTRSPAAFQLKRVAAGEAVFEAPEHDFPKRIVYRLVDRRLVARIDGGEGSDGAREWEMDRAACGGGT